MHNSTIYYCYLVVQECGVVYHSVHLDAIFVTEFTREQLELCSRSLFLLVAVSSKKREIFKSFQIQRSNVAFCMHYKNLKQGKYPTVNASLSISYPSHIYLTGNSKEILLSFPRAEAIRMNLKNQFEKVRLEVPELIRCPRSYLQFRNTISEL